jgi:putative ABC transport system permease protein
MEEWNTSPIKPPRIAEKILGFLYSDRRAFTHLGDFEEVYNEIRGRSGVVTADLWYIFQIFRSIPGFILTKFYWSAIMFRNYFVISLRNLIRDKGISLINLAGLAVGIACFLLILTYVRFEVSYDRFHEKADRIYRVLAGSVGMGSGLSTSTSDVLASALTSHIPGIARATIIYPDTGELILEYREKRFDQRGLFADASFLDVFSFPMARGDKRTALSNPSSIVLTESTALKFFGSEDPVGKVISRKNTGGSRDLTVTGILRDAPLNSHLQFDYIVSLETLRSSKSASEMFGSWDICYFTTYIELAPGQDCESAENLIPAMMSKVSNDKDRSFMKFSFQPLKDIHLQSKSISEDSSHGDIRYVRLFLTIAFLILLIACINHINLATAQAAVRAKEIGIRKVTGAHRAQIFEQFLSESFFTTALSGGLALGLIVLAMPRFDHLFGVSIKPQLLGFNSLWPWLAATVVFVSLCAGVYPAFVLSASQPVRILREHTSSGKKRAFLRSFLVVFQFTASVSLIMATIVVFSQMKYVKSERLGYNREQVVIIRPREQETVQKLPVIKSALEERPEVVKASLSSSLPTGFQTKYYGLNMTKDDGTTVKLDFDTGYIDENFLDVFEIGLVSGRNFRAGDKNVMLMNEAALNELGWKEPIGKKFRGGPNEIVGIIKDFQNGSLHKKIGPMQLFYSSGRRQIAVRVRPGDITKTIGVLRAVFEQNNPGQPFDFYFLDDIYNALYKKEIRTGRIFGSFAVLATLIACLGLLGLTSFTVSRRTHEIGIRKVMGASVSRLVFLLSRDFVKLVIIANVIAWPLAFYLMNRWLQDFVYRINIRPWIFILSSILSLTGALFVAGWKTLKAAQMNPADILRRE